MRYSQAMRAGTDARASLYCVAGARPNFMKLAPLIRALNESDKLRPVLIHTGQHYDEKMSGAFFRDLGLPQSDHFLGAGSGSHAQQTAEIMKRFEPVVEEGRPDGVVVVGDVNSTLACALVAAKLQIPVVHVESGLRSFDRTMPEEINRIVTDALSEVLLVSEASGVKNLRAEGVPEERIHLVGNLMIDSLERHVGEARRLGMAARVGEKPGGYGLVTLHRPANVDDLSALSGILEALKQISEELPLIFPVHPRTRGRLEEARVWEGARIRLTDPLGYVEFLGLMADSAAVLTDSGGIQEETTVLGVPCLTLRENTERPATIEEGTNVLAGTKKEGILEAWARMRGRSRTGRVPQFWDGRSAERCVAVLESYFCGPSGRSARR